MSDKIKVTTTSLAGCFGCHMSFLDIDEKILDLVELVEFTRTPLTDIKDVTPSDVAIIEGGVCNAENVELLKEFRRQSKIVVAMGACSINGGIPALRNHYQLKECLDEAYLHGIGVENPQIPNDPELPLLLNKVHPIHDVVKVDYFLPGCPPPAETIWTFLEELISGKEIEFTYQQIHYD